MLRICRHCKKVFKLSRDKYKSRVIKHCDECREWYKIYCNGEYKTSTTKHLIKEASDKLYFIHGTTAKITIVPIKDNTT